jgi:hypothetical protein
MHRHPEQYPTVTEADKQRIRDEMHALGREAGRWESQVEYDEDLGRNITLPLFLNAAAAAATAPIALVAWPVRAVGAFFAGFGVGEGLQGKTVSLKPDSFGRTTPLKGSDRAWHLVLHGSGVVLSVAGEVQIARSEVPQLVKSPFKSQSGTGRAPVTPVTGPVHGPRNPLDLTIGELLEGYDPNSMIHVTPVQPAGFAAPRGVDAGSFWARLGDVEHLTLHQFRVAVVAPGAPGNFPNATTIVVAPPGSTPFVPRPAVGGLGYPEYMNTQPVFSFATVEGPPGPPMGPTYADTTGIPPYTPPQP